MILYATSKPTSLHLISDRMFSAPGAHPDSKSKGVAIEKRVSRKIGYWVTISSSRHPLGALLSDQSVSQITLQ